MNIPTYVICLQKTRAKRCDPTYHAWKKVLPLTQRLTAITPDDFDLKEVAHPYALSCIRRKKRKTLEFIASDKEVACAMSHITAWKKIVETNQPSIVVEDDMAMSETHIRNMVNQLNRMPDDTEMYLLQFNGINLKSKKMTRGYIDVHQFTGTLAYYLTPQGAKKLLANAFPIVFQVDTYAARAGLRVRSRKENQMPWLKFMKDNLGSTLGKNHISSRMFAMLIAMVVLVIVLLVLICTWASWGRKEHRRLETCQASAKRLRSKSRKAKARS